MYLINTYLFPVAGDSVPLIAGGAAAGGITLAAIAIVIIVFLRRYRQIGMFLGHLSY